MKTLLINPPAKKIAEKKDIPKHQHLGLGYLSAALDAAGYEIRVVDAKLERKGFDEIIADIAAFRPDVVGITAMTHEIAIAAEMAERCKKLFPEIYTVIGGVHVTALPEMTLSQYTSFDIGIIGEGEIVFPRVLESIGNNKEGLSNIPGVVYRKPSGQVAFTAAERIQDVDALPVPAWKYFPKAESYIITTSRGCPYSCVFCMQALGRMVRRKSPESVLKEVEAVLAEKPPKKFLFYDETFTLDKERAKRICDLFIAKGLNKKIKWNVTTRVDVVDEELLKKLKEAGCDHIEFGVESGNEEMLKTIKKKITKEQARQAVRLAKGLGFHTEGAFILGHPNETMETAIETINFAAELNPDIIQLGIMVPYPGTEVREIALRGEGGYRILSENWAEYNKQLGNALELVSLSRRDLEKLQLAGYMRLFFYNRRYLDFLKFVFSFRMEMVSYLRNFFRKRENTGKTGMGMGKLLKLVFCR